MNKTCRSTIIIARYRKYKLTAALNIIATVTVQVKNRRLIRILSILYIATIHYCMISFVLDILLYPQYNSILQYIINIIIATYCFCMTTIILQTIIANCTDMNNIIIKPFMHIINVICRDSPTQNFIYECCYSLYIFL